MFQSYYVQIDGHERSFTIKNKLEIISSFRTY